MHCARENCNREIGIKREGGEVTLRSCRVCILEPVQCITDFNGGFGPTHTVTSRLKEKDADNFPDFPVITIINEENRDENIGSSGRNSPKDYCMSPYAYTSPSIAGLSELVYPYNSDENPLIREKRADSTETVEFDWVKEKRVKRKLYGERLESSNLGVFTEIALAENKVSREVRKSLRLREKRAKIEFVPESTIPKSATEENTTDLANLLCDEEMPKFDY